jgi:hypothetical protein
MFNLNFDICLVPFHAILTEITVFKLKQAFLEPPRISWKGPIKTNLYHFLAIIVSISGLVWRDQLFWAQTLLKEISTRDSSSNWLAGQVYMYDSQFERASWSDCYSICRNLKQQMIQNSFDCMISRARRCIRAGGHAFTDKYRRLFLTTSANVLTIKYNASQHKLLHVVCINI